MGSGGPNAQKHFEHQREVVKEFINNKTNPKTTFTVITYDQNTAKNWKVNEPNKIKRNKLIDSIFWHGHGTRVDLGLEEAFKVLRKKKPKTQKRVYVFVSQMADVGTEPVKRAVGKLLNDGTELVTIQLVYEDGKEDKKVVPRTKFVVKSHVRDGPKKLAQFLLIMFYTGKIFGLA